MIKVQKLSIVVVVFFILFSFLCFLSPAFAQGTIPSLGKGPYEVILFSDYFCPPCKRIDTKAEPLMKELLTTGKVKITFVDVPFHSETPIYARHYLYAVNAGAHDENVLRIRRALFRAAQEKNIKTQQTLAAYLKEEKINWKPYDEKPVFALLSQMIRKNNIDQTPTCVIRYPMVGENKYIGDEEIWNGLMQLKKMLKTAGK